MHCPDIAFGDVTKDTGNRFKAKLREALLNFVLLCKYPVVGYLQRQNLWGAMPRRGISDNHGLEEKFFIFILSTKGV